MHQPDVAPREGSAVRALLTSDPRRHPDYLDRTSVQDNEVSNTHRSRVRHRIPHILRPDGLALSRQSDGSFLPTAEPDFAQPLLTITTLARIKFLRCCTVQTTRRQPVARTFIDVRLPDGKGRTWRTVPVGKGWERVIAATRAPKGSSRTSTKCGWSKPAWRR